MDALKESVGTIETTVKATRDNILPLVPAEEQETASKEFIGLLGKVTQLKLDISAPPDLKEKKREEINKSIDRWSQLSIDQLSFFNNLLIVLGTGFLGFAFKDSNISRYIFSIKDYQIIPTATFFCLLFITISVLAGLLCGFNRLLVFNHSNRVGKIRMEFLEYNIDENKKPVNKVKFAVRFLFVKPDFYSTVVDDYSGTGEKAKIKLEKLIDLLSKFRWLTAFLLKVEIISFILSIVAFVVLISNK
jgi:hypothetical protein